MATGQLVKAREDVQVVLESISAMAACPDDVPWQRVISVAMLAERGLRSRSGVGVIPALCAGWLIYG